MQVTLNLLVKARSLQLKLESVLPPAALRLPPTENWIRQRWWHCRLLAELAWSLTDRKAVERRKLFVFQTGCPGKASRTWRRKTRHGVKNAKQLLNPTTFPLAQSRRLFEGV